MTRGAPHPCAVCGARVTLRESGRQRAFTVCNGELEEKACGSRVVYGARHSRQLLGESSAASAPPAAPRARATRAPAAAKPRKTAPPAPTTRTPAPRPAAATRPPAASRTADDDDGFGSLSSW